MNEFVEHIGDRLNLGRWRERGAISNGVLAPVDPLAQGSCFSDGSQRRPVGVSADCVAVLPLLNAIVQNESADATGRDPHAKTPRRRLSLQHRTGKEMDLATPLRDGKSFDDFLVKPEQPIAYHLPSRTAGV